MKTSLTKGLNQDDRNEIKGLFVAALRLRKQLVKVLDEKKKVAENESLTKEGYDSPSWAYKQADLVGYKRALNELISILSDE